VLNCKGLEWRVSCRRGFESYWFGFYARGRWREQAGGPNLTHCDFLDISAASLEFVTTSAGPSVCIFENLFVSTRRRHCLSTSGTSCIDNHNFRAFKNARRQFALTNLFYDETEMDRIGSMLISCAPAKLRLHILAG